jgi:hypothetical protein
MTAEKERNERTEFPYLSIVFSSLKKITEEIAVLDYLTAA